MAGNLENVGYCLPGYQCVYNIDIMEETAPILAFGAGAISKWVFDRQRRIERAPNVKNIEEYIGRVDEMIERKRKLYGMA
jgi:oxygen-independent coproporphyrinogen-3 oxidase